MYELPQIKVKMAIVIQFPKCGALYISAKITLIESRNFYLTFPICIYLKIYKYALRN